MGTDTVTTAAHAADADALRKAMVDTLRSWGGVRTAAVEAAGVLQCAAGHPITADLAASALTAAVDPRHTFAVQNIDNHTASDDPGLLTGAAGIALALADHGGIPASEISTRWDAALLLS